MTETTFTLPSLAEQYTRRIARETEADLTNFAVVATERASARRHVADCNAHHAETSPEWGPEFALTVDEARSIAYAAMAALGVEQTGTDYRGRPNYVGPYVSDAVRHVLKSHPRTAELTQPDYRLVHALAALANVSLRL